MSTMRCELCREVFDCKGAFDSHLKYSSRHRRHEDLKNRLRLNTYEKRMSAERGRLKELILGQPAKKPVEKDSGASSDLDISRQVDVVLSGKHDTDDRQGRVLLYYCYADVSNPTELRLWQVELCKMLKLRGRIHVAGEGINGTVAGHSNETDLYELAMRSHAIWGPLFRETDFKRSTRQRNQRVFSSLFVKECTEIISLGIAPSKITWKDGAKHLSPREFHDMLIDWHAKKRIECDGGVKGSDDEEGGDKGLVLLDCRNLYESAVGRFDGALRCPTRHFTEFPEFADRAIETMKLRDKKVLMYCTGGIRCERASAYLRSQGVHDCFQLRGGIARYVETFDHDSTDEDSLFRGRNFVFDRRLALERCGNRIVGVCRLCSSPWDEYSTSYACDSCGSLCLVCETCRWEKKKGTNTKNRKKGRDDGVSTPPSTSTSSSSHPTLRCEYCAIGVASSSSAATKALSSE